MTEIRIKMLTEVPVELDALPVCAWGRCFKRSAERKPLLQGDAGFVMPAVAVDQWVLPIDAVIQLPADRAAAYIDAGQAELVESKTGLGTYQFDEPENREKS